MMMAKGYFKELKKLKKDMNTFESRLDNIEEWVKQALGDMEDMKKEFLSAITQIEKAVNSA